MAICIGYRVLISTGEYAGRTAVVHSAITRHVGHVSDEVVWRCLLEGNFHCESARLVYVRESQMQSLGYTSSQQFGKMFHHADYEDTPPARPCKKFRERYGG